MSELIKPDDIPTGTLKEYIKIIQELYNYKVISYNKIKAELKNLFGIEVDIDRIEENCDDECVDKVIQYKNLGMVW